MGVAVSIQKGHIWSSLHNECITECIENEACFATVIEIKSSVLGRIASLSAWMRTTATDVAWSVCVSVGHDHELC